MGYATDAATQRKQTRDQIHSVDIACPYPFRAAHRKRVVVVRLLRVEVRSHFVHVHCDLGGEKKEIYAFTAHTSGTPTPSPRPCSALPPCSARPPPQRRTTTLETSSAHNLLAHHMGGINWKTETLK